MRLEAAFLKLKEKLPSLFSRLPFVRREGHFFGVEDRTRIDVRRLKESSYDDKLTIAFSLLQADSIEQLGIDSAITLITFFAECDETLFCLQRFMGGDKWNVSRKTVDSWESSIEKNNSYTPLQFYVRVAFAHVKSHYGLDDALRILDTLISFSTTMCLPDLCNGLESESTRYDVLMHVLRTKHKLICSEYSWHPAIDVSNTLDSYANPNGKMSWATDDVQIRCWEQSTYFKQLEDSESHLYSSRLPVAELPSTILIRALFSLYPFKRVLDKEAEKDDRVAFMKFLVAENPDVLLVKDENGDSPLHLLLACSDALIKEYGDERVRDLLLFFMEANPKVLALQDHKSRRVARHMYILYADGPQFDMEKTLSGYEKSVRSIRNLPELSYPERQTPVHLYLGLRRDSPLRKESDKIFDFMITRCPKVLSTMDSNGQSAIGFFISDASLLPDKRLSDLITSHPKEVIQAAKYHPRLVRAIVSRRPSSCITAKFIHHLLVHADPENALCVFRSERSLLYLFLSNEALLQQLKEEPEAVKTLILRFVAFSPEGVSDYREKIVALFDTTFYDQCGKLSGYMFDEKYEDMLRGFVYRFYACPIFIDKSPLPLRQAALLQIYNKWMQRLGDSRLRPLGEAQEQHFNCGPECKDHDYIDDEKKIISRFVSWLEHILCRVFVDTSFVRAMDSVIMPLVCSANPSDLLSRFGSREEALMQRSREAMSLFKRADPDRFDLLEQEFESRHRPALADSG